jgi:RHS repeat-associated protein
MGVDTGLMAAASNPAGWVSGQMHSYLTYGLDDANNRTATGVQDAGGTATTDYDLQGGSHPQGPSNRYDAVGPLGGALTPYEYDGRGNLIRDGVFVFRYDYLNRLQEVWKIRVDGDDDTEQYALVLEGADEEARQEVKLEVPDLMQRLPREHTNPTFRARLRAEITGGVIRLRGTGQSGGGMPSFTTPAQADLHAVYAYDAYNRRIMGIVVGVDTQFHTWDGWRQVVQYSLDTAPNPDAAVPTKQFVWGSRLDELLSYRRKNGSAWENYFVLHGGQDTAAKLVNSSGTVVEQYEYDAYGKVSVYVGSSTTAVAESSVGLPFLWKGVRLDSETGLLFMRNRYYSAALGRFLTRDPLGVWGDYDNLGCELSYARNNPLVIGDPVGLQSNAVSRVYGPPTLDEYEAQQRRDELNKPEMPNERIWEYGGRKGDVEKPGEWVWGKMQEGIGELAKENLPPSVRRIVRKVDAVKGPIEIFIFIHDALPGLGTADVPLDAVYWTQCPRCKGDAGPYGPCNTPSCVKRRIRMAVRDRIRVMKPGFFGDHPKGLGAADIDIEMVPPRPVEGSLNQLWHGPHYDVRVGVPDLRIDVQFKLGEALYKLGPGGDLNIVK